MEIKTQDVRVKKPTIKQALECLEIVCKSYKLKMTIYYQPKMPWTPNPGWKIKIMDKSFQSMDFIKVAAEAVSFVYNAHQNPIEHG